MAIPPASYPGLITAAGTVVNEDLSVGWTSLEAGEFGASNMPTGLVISTAGVVTGTTVTGQDLTRTVTPFYQPDSGDVVLGPSFDWRVGDGIVFESHPVVSNQTADSFDAAFTVIEPAAPPPPTTETDFVFEVTVTDGYVFDITQNAAYSHSGTINYGDGTGDLTVVGPEDSNYIHTYVTGGTYEVRRSGYAESWSLPSAHQAVINRVINFGDLQYGRLAWFMSGFTNPAPPIDNNAPVPTGHNVMFTMEYFLYQTTTDGEFNLANLDTSGLTLFDRTLRETVATKIDVSNWDVTGITNASHVFRDSAFGTVVGLDTWNLTNCTNMSNAFLNSGLSTEEYDKTLIAWQDQLPWNAANREINMGGSQYTSPGPAADARAAIIAAGHSINDGGPAS